MHRDASKHRIRLARRIQQAVEEAGLTGYQVSKRLGVHFPTVYRWMRGQRAPAPASLQAFAAVVGKPVAYFYEAEETVEALPVRLTELLLCWARILMVGEEPGAALVRAIGGPVELRPGEQQELAAAAPRMRAALRQAAGAEWDLLTEAEQRQILDQVVRFVQRHHASPRDEE